MRAGAALVRAGFEVSMLDIGAEDASTAEEEREGICIKHVPVSKAFFATRFKGWSLFRAIAMFIRSALHLVRAQVDIYHALDLPALPACYIAATVHRKPLVFESYELPLSTLPQAEMDVSRSVLQALFALFLRHIIPRCAATVVVSSLIKKEIHRSYPCSHVAVVRNIAPYQKVSNSGKLRQRLRLAPHIRVALYQGYLQPDRGLDILVKAAPFLEQEVVIVLMGEDRLGTLARLEALITSEGVADRVKIIPAVPYEELLEWTASSDMGLIVYPPDYSQNVQMMLPNKLFEFLMAGVPVLASPLEAVAEVIRAYGVGQVVSSLAPPDIGAAINAMLADQHALDRMRCNALRAAQEDLNWEKEQQKLVRLYHEILTSDH
jgi:glycosyltransferase involved in cell wall biosynthesis